MAETNAVDKNIARKDEYTKAFRKAANFFFRKAKNEKEQKAVLQALIKSHCEFTRICREELNINACGHGLKDCNGTCIPENEPCPPIPNGAHK